MICSCRYSVKIILCDPEFRQSLYLKTLDQIIVRNDNLIAMKVNKYITANFNLVLINDVTVSTRTQMKEALSIGFSYTIL